MHSHGHLNADIDPLRLRDHYAENKSLQDKYLIPSGDPNNQKLLDYRNYGFSEADLDRTFTIDLPHSGAILASKK
jgi:2-oxoglutarate dehydrogenase complex dehydrogenase (E1) component-like enzyme